MRRRFLSLGIMATVAGATFAGAALAGPVEMFLTSGGQTTTVLIGSTGDPSSVSWSGTINGWTITAGTGGTSYSPGLNTAVGIDLGGYTATCVGVGGCSKDSLTIAVSATGFTTPIDTNGFLMEFSGNVHGGQVTSSSYWDTANTYFCNSGGGAVNDCGSSDLIHTLTLGNGTGEQLRSGRSGYHQVLFTDRGSHVLRRTRRRSVIQRGHDRHAGRSRTRHARTFRCGTARLRVRGRPPASRPAILS